MVSRLASGAAVDRYESDRQRHTAVINFLGSTKDKSVEEESRSVAASTATYGGGEEEKEEEEYDYYEEEDYYEDGDGLSGDNEPRGEAVVFHVSSVVCWSASENLNVCFARFVVVAMSSKPKDLSVVRERLAESTGEKETRGKGRKKGKGRKRNPCLKKYKDLCIHGTCHYLKDIRAPTCV